MKSQFLTLLAAAVISTASGWSAIVYDNTATERPTVPVFSVGPYSEIGDSITLGGTDRFLTDATVRFFNLGSAGDFAATLNFWDNSSPVVSLIGSSTINPLSINELDGLTVTFSNLNLLLPDSLIFTVSILNLTDGLDLALIAAESPSPGSSNDEEIITRIGSSDFASELTGAGDGNLYLKLDATTVPEPATLTMAASAMLALLAARKRSSK